MTLEDYQVQYLLNIIHKNQIMVLGDYSMLIGEVEVKILSKYGICYSDLVIEDQDSIYNPINFYFLSISLLEVGKEDCTFRRLSEYVIKGKYIPLSKREEIKVDYVQTIFREDKVLSSLAKEIILNGILDRLTSQQIISNVGHATGTWTQFTYIDDLLNRAYDYASTIIKKENEVYNLNIVTREKIRCWIGGKECFV